MPISEGFRLPDGRTVTEWAEETIVLDKRVTSSPGSFRVGKTPYLREIMDVQRDKRIKEITFLASTQVGKTLAMIICRLWALDQRPRPAMYVMPTEVTTKRFGRSRIMPVIESSPKLARHLTGQKNDTRGTEYWFNGMPLFFAWANSPSMLSSQPVGDVDLDEIDKFPGASKKEADPESLARERTKTFWDRKIRRASTPTTVDGPIWKAWLRSDRRMYFIPCPHCGEFQTLEFSQLRWDKSENSESLRANKRAHYKCAKCAGEIRDHHKKTMLTAGKWRATNPDIVDTSHAGFKITTLYAPPEWITFSDIAAEFLESKDDPEKLQNFKNSWLAEPWEDRIDAIKISATSMVAGRPRGIVPNEAQCMTCGVDWHGTEKGFYWSAWAWSIIDGERRGWLVDYGRTLDYEDLPEQTFMKDWVKQDGSVFHAPVLCGVDSGWQAPTVYKFCQPYYPQVRPTKGMQTITGATIRESMIDTTKSKTLWKMMLLDINTNYYKDLLSANLGGSGRFQLADGVCDDFLKHLQNEHKIRDGQKLIWAPKYSGAPQHWLDTVVINCAIADWAGFSSMGGKKLKVEKAIPQRKVNQSSGGFVKSGGRWLK